MPLSRARDRERKRIARASVQPKVLNPVQPKYIIAGLEIEGNRILGCTKVVQPTAYNPAIHRTGDRVLIKPLYGKKPVEVTIPEVDADGYPIPDYETSFT